MARNNKKYDPLRKEEIKIVQDRHTETVLQAVLMFSEDNVGTAVSKARKFLRDELEETQINEKYRDLLLQDDIPVPDSVLSENRNPRFGKRTERTESLLGDTDGFLSEMSSDQPIHEQKPFSLPVQEEKKRNTPLPQRKESLPSSRKEKRSNSQTEKQIRAQEIRDAKEEEYSRTATTPASETDYDFLDSEEVEQTKSLIIPEDTGWDDWDEDDESIPKKADPTPKPLFSHDSDNDDSDGDLISQEELEEMWSVGELKKDKKPNTTTVKDLYEDLF